MLTPHDSTTTAWFDQATGPTDPPARSLTSNWARGRRQITPWAYPRLGLLVVLRAAIGMVVGGIGVVMLTRGYYALAAVPLAGAALLFSIAYLDSTVVRSAAHHT